MSAALFGTATPLTKTLLAKNNPFVMAGLLYLGAAAATLPAVILRRKSIVASEARRRSVAKLVGIVATGGFIGPVLLMFGLQAAAAASVSIWLNLELAATALLGIAFFRDRLDAPGWASVSLALVAGVLVAMQEGLAGIVPGLFVACACLCWGIDNQLTSTVDGADPATITFIKGVFAGSANLTIGLLAGGTTLDVHTTMGSLGIGALSYGVSIPLYVISAQNLGATRAQVLFATGPFWGVLVSVLFLGEALGLYHFAAMVSLACGVALVGATSHRHEHEHDEQEHVHLHSHDEHHAHGHAGGDPPEGVVHSHIHVHARIKHAHWHLPDLHHRHGHKRETGK